MLSEVVGCNKKINVSLNQLLDDYMSLPAALKPIVGLLFNAAKRAPVVAVPQPN